jgi:hypothetical protein
VVFKEKRQDLERLMLKTQTDATLAKLEGFKINTEVSERGAPDKACAVHDDEVRRNIRFASLKVHATLLLERRQSPFIFKGLSR